jgi:hypothetical protein
LTDELPATPIVSACQAPTISYPVHFDTGTYSTPARKGFVIVRGLSRFKLLASRIVKSSQYQLPRPLAACPL